MDKDDIERLKKKVGRVTPEEAEALEKSVKESLQSPTGQLVKLSIEAGKLEVSRAKEAGITDVEIPVPLLDILTKLAEAMLMSVEATVDMKEEQGPPKEGMNFQW